MSSSFKAKRHPKASRVQKKARREVEAREVAEAERRVDAEAPPHGTNPLAADLSSSGGSSRHSVTADSAPSAAAVAVTRTAPSSGVVYSGVRLFSELPLSSRTQRALTEKGFTRLTDVQRAAIPHALAGRDILGAARTGSGKCFARGTRLRLYNGDTIAVERIVGGEQLMGDDGQPRTVTPGSLVHHVPTVQMSDSDDDSNARPEGAELEPLYRITPTWEGARPFTVNGAHILVLVNNAKPSLAQQRNGSWSLQQWTTGTDNVMRRLSAGCYRIKAQADAALQAALRQWQPLEWEVSVDEFLKQSATAQRLCKLTACKAITFTNPQLPRLSVVLAGVLGVAPTAMQVKYMAWWLGAWVTDGDSAQPRISQGGAPPPDPHHHHQIFARLHNYTRQFNEPVAQVLDKVSTAGWSCYWFRYGMGSVAGRVLQAYGLIGNKHIPRALICDSIVVRRFLLAGIIDGDGYYSADNNDYGIAAKRRHVLDGYKELAATLGLRNSLAHPHVVTNQQTGEQYDGYRIYLSGDMWDVVQYCAATYKRCPQPGTPGYVVKNKDSRCYGFTITELDEGEYFGFAVHGGANRRFLLEDYTVTHNTLAFLIPTLEALWRSGWSRADGVGAIIISPTRELALQIFDVLRSIGVHHELSAGLIIGGKSVEEEQARIAGMNILVCTPGRLLQHMDQTYGFDVANLRLLVLDEADRILDMGFRQTMNDIVQNLPATRQTLLFSATQTKSVRDLARLSLREPEYLAVHEQDALSTPDRLEQHYMQVAAHSKFDLLFSFIKTHLKSKTLVFVSACKQVRFLYEMFRRVRPGVPLLHLHGKMAQAKRMALYYQFCEKDDVVMFATDIAARGLDFPDVDWIVQMDAPESVATYIHRVGRTARYRAGGKALLFVLPSEMALVAKLQAAKVKVARVAVNPLQLKSVASAFQSFMVEDNDLKFLGQKALLAYLKSVYLQSDKQVFDLAQIDVHALALAMGLQAAPKLSIKLNRGGQKDKNVPYQLRDLLEGRADKKSDKAAAAGGEERGMKEMDRLLRRKNQGPLSETRMRMAAGEAGGDDGEQDDILTVKRTLSVAEDADADDEAKAAADEAMTSSSSTSRASKQKRKRVENAGAEEEEEAADNEARGGSSSSSSWIHAAVSQLAAEDVGDKQRERERIHAKHQQRRLKERAYNAKKQGPAEAALDENVQLAQVDGDDSDVEEEQAAEGDSVGEERDDEQHQEEDDSVDEEQPVQRHAGSKGKRQVRGLDTAAHAPSAKRKRRDGDIASLPLAQQEAMALRSLQSDQL